MTDPGGVPRVPLNPPFCSLHAYCIVKLASRCLPHLRAHVIKRARNAYELFRSHAPEHVACTSESVSVPASSEHGEQKEVTLASI